MDGEDPYEFALMLGEPSLPVTGAGWDEIESALGVGLPEDYKAWGDRYRSLRFAEYLIIDNLRDDLELVSLDRIPVRVGTWP